MSSMVFVILWYCRLLRYVLTMVCVNVFHVGLNFGVVYMVLVFVSMSVFFLFITSGCCLLCCDVQCSGCVGCCDVCLICDACSWKCSFMGSVCISSRRCFVLSVVCV